MESAEEKSDLLTCPYIKLSLTVEQKWDEANNVFLCAFEQVPALLVVFLFRLWLLNYWAGAFVFIYDVSVFLEHLETKSSSQKKKKDLRFISQLPSAVKRWDSCERGEYAKGGIAVGQDRHGWNMAV